MNDAILRRDRMVVLAGLVVITLLSWVYIVLLAWQMDQTSMDMGISQTVSTSTSMPMATSISMPQTAAWTGLEFVLTLIMWAVMMVAMMIPSATPMILTYANISRKRHAEQRPFGPTTLFVFGYVTVWVGFSLVAATGQWLLHSATLLSPMMVTTSTLLGSALLIGAGLFQFTSLKHRCLQLCRTPLSFFLNEWREGKSGAFQMGFKHGAYCLGCCWLLMALLFVAGVMNLLWVALLAILVLLEKLLPAGPVVARIAGVAFLLWGVWLIAGVVMGNLA